MMLCDYAAFVALPHWRRVLTGLVWVGLASCIEVLTSGWVWAGLAIKALQLQNRPRR